MAYCYVNGGSPDVLTLSDCDDYRVVRFYRDGVFGAPAFNMSLMDELMDLVEACSGSILVAATTFAARYNFGWDTDIAG